LNQDVEDNFRFDMSVDKEGQKLAVNSDDYPDTEFSGDENAAQ
jgi:hypothetical protein